MAKLKRYNGSSWEEIPIEADTVNGYSVKDGTLALKSDIGKAVCTSTSSNANSKPWHRFATLRVKSVYYSNNDMLVLIQDAYTNSRAASAFYLNLRTNDSNSKSEIKFSWVFRNTDFVTIKAALRVEWEDTYVDLFYKSQLTYDCKRFHLIAGGNWQSSSCAFTFMNSLEDKTTAMECYESIEAAGTALYGQEYSSISEPTTKMVAYADPSGNAIETTYAKKTEIPTKVISKQRVLDNGVDLNTVMESGFYRLQDSMSNSPDDGGIFSCGQLLVVQGGGDTITQMIFPYSNSNVWIRNGNCVNNSNGVWQGWVRIARADEIPSVNDGALTMQVEGSTKATFTANQSSAATFNVTASDLGLSQALKFVGKFDSLPTASDYSVGNVILVGNKEYVLLDTSGSKAWDEMGDESSHALNTVTITGTGALGGGGNLKSNQTITHNTVTRADTTSSEGKGFGGSFTAVDSVTSDSYGHVTKVNTKTVTLPNAVATQDGAGLMSASDKLKLDGIATGANNMTYTLSSSGATVTLTPSNGTAQSITVDGVSNATYADQATHDSDGNIIASTYVKNTSSQLLSGWSQTFSEIFNKESLPNGIPLLGTTVTGTSSLTGQQITVSSLDFVSLGYATSGKNYAVQKDDNGKLYVNVPWTDTNTTQTTYTTAEYGLKFRNSSYGIDLSGYSAGLHFATSSYRITDIETGTIDLTAQAFTANSSVSKSVTFHNKAYYNSSGGTTTGGKQGSLRVFLQFVGYNGEQMTCGLISLSDTGFTAYCRCNATLSASSTRYIHWLKVREY